MNQVLIGRVSWEVVTEMLGQIQRLFVGQDKVDQAEVRVDGGSCPIAPEEGAIN